MKIILNERVKVDEVIKRGKIDEKAPMREIRLLIKHHFSLGMDDIQVRETVEKWLEDHCKWFNKVTWMRKMDNAIKSVLKYGWDLLEITEVYISKKELDIIIGIDNKVLEKVAFVLLVYSKINNAKKGVDANWVNDDLFNIFRDAKIKIGSDEQCIIIKQLIELGLIEKSKINNSNAMHVLFVENNLCKDVFKIKSFGNLPQEYFKLKEFYKKDYIIDNCEDCGKLIKKSNNRHKYCKSCWNKREKELKRKWWNEKKI